MKSACSRMKRSMRAAPVAAAWSLRRMGSTIVASNGNSTSPPMPTRKKAACQPATSPTSGSTKASRCETSWMTVPPTIIARPAPTAAAAAYTPIGAARRSFGNESLMMDIAAGRARLRRRRLRCARETDARTRLQGRTLQSPHTIAPRRRRSVRDEKSDRQASPAAGPSLHRTRRTPTPAAGRSGSLSERSALIGSISRPRIVRSTKEMM